MLAVYSQYTRRQQKTQYQQPKCDTKGREKWPFPGRTVTILRYQRSADSLRARSSRPCSGVGVRAAQRAARAGEGLESERPRQRPVGPLTGSGAEVQSGSDGPTPATSRAPIAGTAHLRPASSQWARLGAVPDPAGVCSRQRGRQRRGLVSMAAKKGGRGCAGRRPPAAPGRMELDCGGADQARATSTKGECSPCGRARPRGRSEPGRGGRGPPNPPLPNSPPACDGAGGHPSGPPHTCSFFWGGRRGGVQGGAGRGGGGPRPTRREIGHCRKAQPFRLRSPHG